MNQRKTDQLRYRVPQYGLYVAVVTLIITVASGVYNWAAWSQEQEDKIRAVEVEVKRNKIDCDRNYIRFENEIDRRCIGLEKQIKTNKQHIVGLENREAVQERVFGEVKADLKTIKESVNKLTDLMWELVKSDRKNNGDK